MSEEDFYQVDGFQRRLAERTYENIHNGLQNVSVDVVLGSAGVFGIGLGKRKMKALFDAIPHILSIYKEVYRNEMLDMVMEVEGFSNKTATKIVDNLQVAEKFIEDISQYATFKNKNLEENKDDGVVSLEGLKFVISGVRDAVLEEKVVSRGGKFVGSVSGNTTCLIVKSKDGKVTGKIQSAMNLGIPVCTLDEFKVRYSL
jgi:NAD-dependent DNA ligase